MQFAQLNSKAAWDLCLHKIWPVAGLTLE